MFINIGKYVDKIDKNITQTISAQKKYSNLISNLRKDIEEFSFNLNLLHVSYYRVNIFLLKEKTSLLSEERYFNLLN